MAIRINRVYTRTGDGGDTHLVGGQKAAKDSLRIEGYGTVDELNAILGLARSFNEPTVADNVASARLDEILKSLQNELFDLGSELATPADAAYEGMYRVGAAEVTALERCIDECQKDLEPLSSFILPGGGRVAAFLHQARTVCRRAERGLVRLGREADVGEWPIKYVNRLGDLLFVLARWISVHLGEPEFLWERGLRLPAGRPPRSRKPR
jgi:cob(I)alamin adenosyltransferase